MALEEFLLSATTCRSVFCGWQFMVGLVPRVLPAIPVLFLSAARTVLMRFFSVLKVLLALTSRRLSSARAAAVAYSSRA